MGEAPKQSRPSPRPTWRWRDDLSTDRDDNIRAKGAFLINDPLERGVGDRSVKYPRQHGRLVTRCQVGGRHDEVVGPQPLQLLDVGGEHCRRFATLSFCQFGVHPHMLPAAGW
ncbi:MAG TPA: hypothetical protein VNO51_17300 [Ilumatobacteraceae bacterium]|nr:hypothetical protein [Ilumatobacteraceae bacterium]